MLNPLRIFRLIARSTNTPKTPLSATPEAIEYEKYKVENHQLALGLAVVPLGILVLDPSLLGTDPSCWDKAIMGVSVGMSALASLLLLGLVQVSRDRVRDALRARAGGEKEVKTHFIRLRTMYIAHALALGAYAALCVLMIRQVWGN